MPRRTRRSHHQKRINDRKAIERDWKVVSRKEEETTICMDSLTGRIGHSTGLDAESRAAI
jgi:hypothetical protein